MDKPRITLDSVSIAHRARTLHSHRRDLAATRVQRHVVRRAATLQHRQPRVRLGKPTSGDAYIHWQEYLDISDLHKQPAAPTVAQAEVEEQHHETVSEMFDRYRHVAENINDKINHLLSDIKPKRVAPEVVEERVDSPSIQRLPETRLVGQDIYRPAQD